MQVTKRITEDGLRWAGATLALTLPFGVYRPFGPAAVPGIFALYARPVLYLSDLAVIALLLVGFFGALKDRQRGSVTRLTLPHLESRAVYGAERTILQPATDRGIVSSLRHLSTPHRAARGAGVTVAATDRPYTVALTLPLLILIALAALSIPTALFPDYAAYTAARWLLAVGVYLLLVRGRLSIERWVTIFVAGLALQALIGLGQVLVQHPLGLPGEQALDPARAGAAVIEVGGSRWLRAYGLTFHPNMLGGFLAVGLILALPLLARWWVRLLWWLLGLGLGLSFSRSAWLATVLLLPPVSLWLASRRPRLRRPLVLTLGGAGLMALFVGVLLSGQLLARARPAATLAETRSLNERGRLIGIALDLVAERPLTGIGAGNFALAMFEVETSMHPQPVHNVPLLLAAEVGALGALVWFWLWLAPGLALSHLRRDQNHWLVVLVAALFGLGIISLWDDYPWALNAGRLLSVTLLGLTGPALEVQ